MPEDPKPVVTTTRTETEETKTVEVKTTPVFANDPKPVEVETTPVYGTPAPALSALEIALKEGESMVKVTVPKFYKIMQDNHRVVDCPAGVYDMPEHLANHWWSKANGVTLFEAKSAADAKTQQMQPVPRVAVPPRK